METLLIGLFIKDSSPISLAFKQLPAIKPIINLIPVPELPRSIELEGLLKGFSRLFILTILLVIEISAPI